MPPAKKAVTTPTACIRRDERFTWCGREAYRNEFLFEDAAHAVKHYANSTTIRACQHCVDAAAPVIMARQYDPPLATRGLRNDR